MKTLLYLLPFFVACSELDYTEPVTCEAETVFIQVVNNSPVEIKADIFTDIYNGEVYILPDTSYTYEIPICEAVTVCHAKPFEHWQYIPVSVSPCFTRIFNVY
jgi:hypothetical protein